jgi:hypothetical protein
MACQQHHALIDVVIGHERGGEPRLSSAGGAKVSMEDSMFPQYEAEHTVKGGAAGTWQMKKT